MIKILFVCHGNICRSIAAQAIALDMIRKMGKEKDFFVDSAEVSREEMGNPMYPPMKRELITRGIEIPFHRARQVTKSDLESFDVIFYMDESNRRLLSMMGLLSENVKSICEFADGFSEIEDPWYSGRYGKVVDQITICLHRYLASLGLN
jgi:protein-tyrosine phosphatase